MMTVRERADWIATFRSVNVRLMEIVAGWVPSTPEMEVKLLFGRHLWEFAQHADSFGKRTAALRLALHASREPTREFGALIHRFGEAADAGERMDGLYDAMIPVLIRFYDEYVTHTDDLMDEGSVRILERARADLSRMVEEARAIEDDLPGIRGSQKAFAGELYELADGVAMVDLRPDPIPSTSS